MSLPGITGRLRVSFDPTLRFAQNGGTAILSIPVSGGKKRKNSEEWDNFEARLTMFGEKAEQYASVKKGDYLAVTGGEMSVASFVNSQGEKKTVVDINATFADVGVLPPLPQQGGQQGQQGAQQGQADPFGAQPQQQPQQAPQGQQAPHQQPQGQPQQNPYQQNQQNPYQQPQQNPYQQNPFPQQ